MTRPVQSFAQAEAEETNEAADTFVNTSPIVVENRVRLAVTVTNDGPGDEPKLISVVNTFPEGTTFASFSGQNWKCDYSEETRTADCQFGAALASGDRTELVLLADKMPDDRDSYLNTTTVLGTLTDPVLDNNSVVTELFYLGRDVTGGVEIGSDETDGVPASDEPSIADDSPNTGRATDDSTTAQQNKPEPILPKTGTNLTASLLAIGSTMALAGYRMVARSEQSKMLALALNQVKN